MENGPAQLAKNKTSNIIFYGISAGLIAYIITGSIGLYLLRVFWTDYAIASQDKSYTFEMLLFRLFVGVFASVIAGITATNITDDKGKTAWLVGTIVIFITAYIHFFKVWADYPLWYHLAYLLPIIPVIGLSGYLISKRK